MKIIKLIAAFFTLCMLCGCHTLVGNWHRQYAKYHLSFGEDNAHQGLFRVDGCYLAHTKEEIESDTVCYSGGFVFYPDGVCADFGLKNIVKENGIVNFDESLYRYKLYPSQWYCLMGVYEVRNDTVYCEMYRWFDLLHISTACEGYKFAIKDSCTLECNRAGNGKDYNWHFVPCTNIVRPREKFIKDRKWMWKTKEDWMKYKESKRK